LLPMTSICFELAVNPVVPIQSALDMIILLSVFNLKRISV